MNKPYTLLQGDCLEVMRGMADNSVDAIVTDPPYGLSFMGKKWDYDVPSVDVWREALRVLKPGGHLLSFSGSRTYHRMAVAVEDAGFEIRDQIMWIYGSGFPKNATSSLKPAHEPCVMARKPLEGTMAANALKHGTGNLNIDACRIKSDENRSRSSGENKNAYGSQSSGEFSQNDGGRFPANLIHDGSEEVVALFPHGKSGGGRKGEGGIRNYLGSSKSNSLSGNRGGLGIGGKLFWDEGRKDHYTLTASYDAEGSASRFFYCAKASKRDRDEGLEGLEGLARQTMGNGIGGQPNQQIANNKNPHPTVKPTTLMRYLVRLITPPSGMVLDPFMGSGSTGKAAMLEGFNFIGIEREPEYLEIARQRIEAAIP